MDEKQNLTKSFVGIEGIVKTIVDVLGLDVIGAPLRAKADSIKKISDIRTSKELELKNYIINSKNLNIEQKMQLNAMLGANYKKFLRKMTVLGIAINNMDENCSKENLEEDWLLDFFDKVGNISNEEIQKLWGHKPWLKYYSEEAISSDFVPMSIFQLMYQQNKGHEMEVALSYFGKEITYGELFDSIDLVAKALLESGIQCGDIVMMSLPNIPEAEYLFYALNKIGAVVNSVDPRVSESELRQDVVDANAKWFFAIDAIYGKIKDFLQGTSLTNIVIVSAANSMPLPLKAAMKAKEIGKKPKYENYVIEWKDFIQKGEKSTLAVPNCYQEDAMAVIVHTGGSTGVSKGVALTNESCNGLIYQMMYSDMGFRRGQRFLNTLPPFIALGINNAMHLSACLGLVSVLIPTFEVEKFPDLIMKNRPNIVMGAPIHFKVLYNVKEDIDLSFLEICCCGGDKMPREIQEKAQEYLQSHKSSANMWIGYGATETSSGISCMKDNCFRFESVGLPYLNNTIGIFDVDTGEEIQGYGEIGELRVSAPTIMAGYFGANGNETKDVIKVESDGRRWYCSGDLAHFDSDGLIYIDGRIKRLILRKGWKIYPAHIESLIMRHPAVRECAVVGIADPEEINIPVANIVLKDKSVSEDLKNEVIDFIEETIKNELPEYTSLGGYNFLEALPLTPIGKLDFRALEKLGIKK